MNEHDKIAATQYNNKERVLGQLLPEYRDKVFRLAWSIVRNREAAEEVTQDVFVKIWQTIDAFNHHCSMATWVYSITRNTAISAYRSQRWSRLNVHSGLDEILNTSADDAESVNDYSISSKSLHNALRQLPAKQQQVVILFYLQECSHAEVSAMLAIPIGTIKTLLHRARHTLLSHLTHPQIR